MKATSWNFDLLKLVFHNAAISHIGDKSGISGSGSDGVFFVSLHTGDPALDESQSSKEATFEGYKRLSAPRNKSHWSIDLDIDGVTCRVSNVVHFVFPEATNGNEKITHVGIGSAENGTGKLLYSGPIKESKTITQGTILAFKPGQIVLSEK